jgi:hypothetical protein
MADTSKHIRKQLTGSGGVSQSLGKTGAMLRRQLWLWPVLAALVIGAVGWWVTDSVEDAMRENRAGQLTALLNADVEALHAWTHDQAAIAQALAHSKPVRAAAGEFLAIADRPDAPAKALLQSPAQAAIRAQMEPFLKNFGYQDFLVISPAMRILASKHDALIQERLEGDKLSFAKKVLTGPASMSRPFRSSSLLPDAHGKPQTGLPSMFAGGAITDDKGKPIAVLALRIAPEQQFTKILQTARFGYSGETYAFSETGLLLSESRFDDDLKRLGLLPDLPDARSILTVEARDPGVDMMAGRRPAKSRAELPLTKLVATAVASGGSGVVIEPYGDYRGSPSIGAYQWLPEYGFGVATEVDVADAFKPLYVLRRAIWALLGLLLVSAVGILAFTFVAARQQRRAEKAEKAIRQLGQYTLEKKIGSGGMGSVYRARHAFLRRPTAVKMLNTGNVTTDSLARFEREVQMTSQLCHPNTIAVYDYGRTPDGVFYYAMEYLDGVSLEDLVKAFGPLPEGRVVSILRQICGSLAEAHAVGLIHRDIKPANVILTARAGLADFVKVLDFGLVKAADADEAAKLTAANVSVGTPHYISPEAVENPESVTAQSDVYAIGAVGYYLLTGTQVFTGKTIMEICMKHVRTAPEPPSQRLGREVSAGLEGLILRCLAKEPADRPAGTRALADELERLEVAGTWTRIDAEEWWAAFKETTGEEAEKVSTSTDAVEQTVAAPTRLEK